MAVNVIDTQLVVVADKQVVDVKQRLDPFAIAPAHVVLPFAAIKQLCAQILLLETGATVASPPGVGEGKGDGPVASGESSPSLRVN